MAIEHFNLEQPPPHIPKEVHDKVTASVLYRFEKQVGTDPTYISTLPMWRHKATLVHALSIAPEELGDPLVDRTLLQLLMGRSVETKGEKRYVPNELNALMHTIGDTAWTTRAPSWKDLGDRPEAQTERISILTLANFRNGRFDPTTPEADERLEYIVERGIRTDNHNTFVLGANGACIDYQVTLEEDGARISSILLADAASINPHSVGAEEFERRYREWMWTAMMFTGSQDAMKYL